MHMVLGKHFEFEASHQLPSDECYGKCRNLHGHRYELEVQIRGPMDPHGWICNFSELKEIVREKIVSRLDHSHLNELFEIPTVEHVALWIFKTLDHAFREKPYTLEKVKVYETSTSYAEIVR